MSIGKGLAMDIKSEYKDGLGEGLEVRKARVGEARVIKGLLDIYAKEGIILYRSLDDIYKSVRDFTVCVIGEQLIGVVALTIYTEKFGEIRSLVVKEGYKGIGVGKELIKSCVEEAKSYGLSRVFTLTYEPNYFIKQGFGIFDKGLLPEKIWRDCINCEHVENCEEKALIRGV